MAAVTLPPVPVQLLAKLWHHPKLNIKFAKFPLYLFAESPSCMQRKDAVFVVETQGEKMIVLTKLVVAALAGGFLWLVGNYTFEYFKPYKRKG